MCVLVFVPVLVRVIVLVLVLVRVIVMGAIVMLFYVSVIAMRLANVVLGLLLIWMCAVAVVVDVAVLCW